ncbi:hypothetical protein ACFFRE_01080 [Aciditerrimonas ferrireducens]|uniref:Uncharacterized protein n=1 Tax=Aciditerrimonas ferrireducens TaxID=667306 RepID=A0ABV6BZ99_9ACTN|nr:hypothetical protein [Aciditerrimonas ferrireducens]MCK4177270.1 hypothetical protein [Aciditerrimonas ferrireducens]
MASTTNRARTSASWPLWVILVLGVLLIVAPFAISLPSKASAGQKMLDAFHPIMAPSHVKETVAYYDQTFTPLGPLASGAVQATSELPGLVGTLATALHTTPSGVEHLLETNFPAMAQLILSFPKLVPIFQKVPSGLTFYKPLVDTMQAQEANYRSVDGLPNFNLFTWFFVVPGALFVILAAIALVGRARAAKAAQTA